MVSTADDYHAFARMLLHGGRHGNERLLARPTVELMTTDQLTAAQKGDPPALRGNRGWGLGVAVVTGRDDLSATPGRYGWDGGIGTSWANDPAEPLIAVLMTQRGAFPRESPVSVDFWTSVYQALDD